MQPAKKLPAVAAAVMLLLTSCALRKDAPPDNLQNSAQAICDLSEIPLSDESIIEKLRYIIHGGGAIDVPMLDGGFASVASSSSLEALNLCSEAGVSAIELDFNFTSDGHLACVHHWGEEINPMFSADSPPALAEFLECKIYLRFTSICLDDVAEFMRENPDVVIVTDIKDKNLEGVAYIAEKAPDLIDRFIIQIYDKDEYSEVKSYGFDNVIYTLYALNRNEKNDFEAIGQFARNHPLIGIAFDHTLCSVESYIDNMLSLGVPIFVHTVNESDIIDGYFKDGISGVYTDNISNSMS